MKLASLWSDDVDGLGECPVCHCKVSLSFFYRATLYAVVVVIVVCVCVCLCVRIKTAKLRIPQTRPCDGQGLCFSVGRILEQYSVRMTPQYSISWGILHCFLPTQIVWVTIKFHEYIFRSSDILYSLRRLQISSESFWTISANFLSELQTFHFLSLRIYCQSYKHSVRTCTRLWVILLYLLVWCVLLPGCHVLEREKKLQWCHRVAVVGFLLE